MLIKIKNGKGGRWGEYAWTIGIPVICPPDKSLFYGFGNSRSFLFPIVCQLAQWLLRGPRRQLYAKCRIWEWDCWQRRALCDYYISISLASSSSLCRITINTCSYFVVAILSTLYVWNDFILTLTYVTGTVFMPILEIEQEKWSDLSRLYV